MTDPDSLKRAASKPGLDARAAETCVNERADAMGPARLRQFGYGLISISDDAGTLFSLAAVTTREGFPTRAELLERYEAKSGRSMSELRWYQTLALWKSAVFLEGSYKRLLAGTTDDPYLKLFDEGVPRLAEAAWEAANLPAPRT